jgi:formate hydrogenlyase subunit 3/multisubunit Na+/H+ antiporter MnhD subunit
MSTQELLLLLAPGLPALLAILWPLKGLRDPLMGLAPWAGVPALLLALHPGGLGASAEFPAIFTGLQLTLDAPARPFLLLTGLLWVVAGAFSRAYHRDDGNKESYFGFFVLTMAGNVGLVLAADALSFYLFFAWMTFAAYGLVIHARSPDALRAGRVYIVLAVLGELAILTALVALGWAAGGAPTFGTSLELAWQDLDTFGYAPVVALLVVAGFGVKAGLIPLHLWLPLAHPVAPTAASALLSGAMIKAGLLAWIRYLPGDQALPLLALGLAILGVAAAFYGVVMGVAQDDPKTVLAYSSVSQMGYMALGTALLLHDPGWAPLALAAVLLYAMHHGLAKGALFLAVGVGDRVRTEGWRGLVLLGAALPALALAGAPLSTGAQAKSALKEAMSQFTPGWYGVLDPLLLVAAAGTTILLTRFIFTLRHRMAASADLGGESGTKSVPWGLILPWGLLVLLGAGGQLWLLVFAPIPDGVELPGAFSNPLGSMGPIVLGGLAAWAVWVRPGLLGSVRNLRIPAGDLVVPLEQVIRWVGSPPLEKVIAQSAQRLKRLRKTQLWSHAQAAWVAERDLYLTRGPVVALLLLALALGLAFFLP